MTIFSQKKNLNIRQIHRWQNWSPLILSSVKRLFLLVYFIFIWMERWWKELHKRKTGKLLNRCLYHPQTPLDKQCIWHSIKTGYQPGPYISEKPDTMKKLDPLGKPSPKKKVGLRPWNISINISTLIIHQLWFFTLLFLQYWKDI